MRYREEEIGCKTRKGASGLVRHVIDLAASNVTSDCVVEIQKFRERKRQHRDLWKEKSYMTLNYVDQMKFQTLGKVTTKLPKLLSLLLDSSHLT